jgi:hypothetical protein
MMAAGRKRHILRGEGMSMAKMQPGAGKVLNRQARDVPTHPSQLRLSLLDMDRDLTSHEAIRDNNSAVIICL